MIENLFTSLTVAMDKTPAIALLASFAWGILSILLSPCHLASIPLIIGFIGSGGDKVTVKRAFFISLFFSLGIMITLAAIGLLVGLAGSMLGVYAGRWGNLLVAAVFIVVGLYFFDILKLYFLSAGISRPKFEKRGYVAAFLIGLIFGISLGSCTFAYMAPMLAVAFSSAADNMFYSISLVLAYAAGHCGVIVLAGTFTEVVEKYLNWSENSKGAVILKKTCGALLLLAAVYLALGVFI